MAPANAPSHPKAIRPTMSKLVESGFMIGIIENHFLP